jgi:hypothetical protein
MARSEPWPFDDPPNLACFTVAEVLSREQPILRVFHDVSDGAWQFLPAEGSSLASAKLVCLEDMVGLDPALSELADLRLGWRAERDSEGQPWTRVSNYPTEWRELVQGAYAYTQDRQERLKAEFSLLEWERFDYDQEQATLVFSSGGLPRLTTKIQIAGSTAKRSGTWLWSWSNATILDSAAEYVHLLRTFGEQHGFERLATARWPADDVDGWEMVSVACLLLGGEGVYRAPDEDGAVFMVLSDPRPLPAL